MFQSTLKSFAVLLPLALTACGGTPEKMMTPTTFEVDSSAKTIPIVVATTRLASEDPGILFTGKRGDLAYANVKISIPPTHVDGEIEWPKSLPADPSKYFATQSAEHIKPQQFRTAVRKNIQQYRTGGKVFVFIHGYNTKFDAAVMRLAQIASDSNSNVTPVLFTWPSQGKLFGYPYDRESAAYSRDALELVLKELANEPSVTDITVLAHSMGNMVALESLRQMAVRNGEVSRKIRSVILASPDVDVDVARTLISGMGKRPPHFTLFISRDDRALMASRLIWGSTDRLGQINPLQEPYRAELAEYKHMDVFDLTNLQTGDSTNHTKFAQSPAVVQFVGKYLMSGKPIDTGRMGLGDHIGAFVLGTTNAVGNAATAAVAAPISIIDPATRENLTDRFGAFVP
ncbi:alpha/beta hydrolase [Hohaiivirga grylli]